MALRDDAVWITGVGPGDAAGADLTPSWPTTCWRASRGSDPVTHFDPTDQPCRVAACLPVPDSPAPTGWDPAEFATLGVLGAIA